MRARRLDGDTELWRLGAAHRHVVSDERADRASAGRRDAHAHGDGGANRDRDRDGDRDGNRDRDRDRNANRDGYGHRDAGCDRSVTR